MKAVKEYELAVEKLAKAFIKKYFSKEDGYWNAECFWVGDEIGGMLSVSDYFFDVNSMVDYMKYNYTEDQMFEYYDYALEETTAGRSPINIKIWLKLKK